MTVTVNMYRDKNGVLRSGWTGKEIEICNVPLPPPAPPKKGVKYVDVRFKLSSS